MTAPPTPSLPSAASPPAPRFTVSAAPRKDATPARDPASGADKQMSRLRLGALLPAALSFLLLGLGCAGYKLGPTGDQRAGEKSIQVNPVVNSTLEPQLGQAVNHALRKQIQRDGTFRLATHGEGDIALNIDLTRYHRRGIAYDPNNTLTATDYELVLEARVLAADRRSGLEILNKEVRGRTTIRIGPDLTSTERQARPILAEALAENVVSLLANGEW